jgi:hypothetical protein
MALSCKRGCDGIHVQIVDVFNLLKTVNSLIRMRVSDLGLYKKKGGLYAIKHEAGFHHTVDGSFDVFDSLCSYWTAR